MPQSFESGHEMGAQSSPQAGGMQEVARQVWGPQGRSPDAEVPRIGLPSLPDINLPQIHLPEIRGPQLNLPDIHLPEIRPPQINVPDPREIASGYGRLVERAWREFNEMRSGRADAAATPDYPPASAGLQHTEEMVDGRTSHRYFLRGRDGQAVEVLSTDKSPEEAENDLRQLRDGKLKDVSQTFGVHISTDGERGETAFSRDVAFRSPTIAELYALESGLAQSTPSIYQNSRQPVKIEFTANRDSPHPAYFSDRDRSVVFEPFSTPSTFDDMERTTIHELAHNGQANVRAADAAAERQFYSDMGMSEVRSPDAFMSDRTHRSLLRDADGRFFTRDFSPQFAGNNEWVQTDATGHVLRADGQFAQSIDEAVRISNDQMRAQAAVRPASDYFPDAREMGADAMTLYRRSAADRREMLTSTPQLYELVKRFDQREIDTIYGVDSDGNSKLIRDATGYLADNTVETRQRLSSWEND